MILIILGIFYNMNFRYIDFGKLKAVAKELGETLNDEELKEMIHHIHILRKTDEPDRISFEEFYEIITAPRRY